jgi:hypothetical protein
MNENSTEPTKENAKTKIDTLFDKFVPYMDARENIISHELILLDREITSDSIIMTVDDWHVITLDWKTPHAINPYLYEEIRFSVDVFYANDISNINSSFFLGFNYDQFFGLKPILIGEGTINYNLKHFMFTTGTLFFAFKVHCQRFGKLKLYNLQIIGVRKD